MKLKKYISSSMGLWLLAALLAFGIPAHAAEQVTLRNGSALVCDHQQNFDGQVRLYLTSSDASYLEVAATEIVAVEFVAPEAVAPAAASQAGSQKAPAAVSADIPTLLQHAGAQHHLDPDLLASVVHAESAGRTHAVSHVGAQGLMQLMPATAKTLGVHDSFAADQNIAGGTAYLDTLLVYYHENIALALAAYNAGPAAVDRYHGIPPYAETRRYVQRVIHDFNQRKRRESQRQRNHAAWVSMAAISNTPAK